MKKMIPYFALCLFVQGCVGVAIQKTRITTIQDPIVPDQREYWPRQRESFVMTNAVVYSAAWLQDHWGKPASITHEGANDPGEIWTYKYDVIWEGIAPMVLVPIPLGLPVGREKVRFLLRDDRIISATHTEPRTVGGAYGFIMGPCGLVFAGAYSFGSIFDQGVE